MKKGYKILYFGIFLSMLFANLAAAPQTPEWVLYDPVNSNLPDTRVLCFGATEDGKIWAGTRMGGMAAFEAPDWTVTDTSNSSLGGQDVTTLATRGTSDIWAGHQAADVGLSRLVGLNWTLFSVSNSDLPEDYLNALHFQEDTLWVGTKHKGLARFDGQNWTVFDTLNSALPSNDILSITSDRFGSIWVGTNGFGVVEYDGANFTTYNQSNSDLPGDTVKSVVPDQTSRMYIGTTAGMAIYEFGFWNVYTTLNSDLPHNHIRAMDFDQDTIYVGTDGGGLASFDGDFWEVYDMSNTPIPDNRISALFVDENGNKWLGLGEGTLNGNGVAVYRKEGVKEVIVGKDAPLPGADLDVWYANDGTSIEFRATVEPGATHRLEVLELNGKPVSLLANEVASSTTFRARWKCHGASAGLYVYRFSTGGITYTGKLVVR